MKKSRNTRQRAVILDILRRNPVHPTAEDIYREARRALPNISLGTVYRNLNFLRDQGYVREVRSPSDTSSRFEAEIPPHAHFHCTECRSVVDVPLPDCLREVSWNSDPAVGTVTFLDLHVIGACSNCAKPAATT